MDMLGDFGAELKEHYLKSILEFIEKIPVDVFKEKSNKKIIGIFEDVINDWIADAQSNELIYFSNYLKQFKNIFLTTKELEPSAKYIINIKAYVEKLISGQSDSIELSKSYEIIFEDAKIYLQCILEEHEFAVPIRSVVEIVTEKIIYPLPDSRNELSGMINFRGEAIPILNLQEYGFNIGSQKRNSLHVICEQNGTRFGLQVSQTDEVISISEKQMQDVGNQAFIQGVNFIEKFYLKGEKTVLVFNLEKLVA